MLVQLLIILGIFLIGLILFKIGNYYSHRYLGFNSTDHIPVCMPSSSSTPALVCVLGWGGCTRRQLRRLLDFYSFNNISTISWINPMFNYIFGIDIKQIERVLDFILHENRTANKIIIHLHSNNGALVWSYMLHIMMTNERYKQLLSNIKGIIFDSAPFTRRNNNWIIQSAIGTSRACVSIILNRVQYFHVIWSPLMMYYLFLRFFYQRYLLRDPLLAMDKLQKFLNMTPIDIKQHYLYSKDDRLVPSSAIGTFTFVFFFLYRFTEALTTLSL